MMGSADRALIVNAVAALSCTLPPTYMHSEASTAR